MTNFTWLLLKNMTFDKFYLVVVENQDLVDKLCMVVIENQDVDDKCYMVLLQIRTLLTKFTWLL